MEEYLMHFNPFHDPKNGQFTSGGSGSRGQPIRKKYRSIKELERVYKNRESNDPKEIDNWVKMQQEILNKSIDTYNDNPVSNRQRRLKEEKRKALSESKDYQSVSAKAEEAYKALENYRKTNRSKVHEALRLDDYKEDNLLKEAARLSREAHDIKNSILNSYNGKTASAVLKDLGFKDTEQARMYLRDSGVLWWD